MFDNRMWVMEGSAEPGVSGKDVWYSADGVNWYELPDTPWIPRHAASVFVHDKRPMDCRRQRQGQDGQRGLEARQQGIIIPLTLYLQ